MKNQMSAWVPKQDAHLRHDTEKWQSYARMQNPSRNSQAAHGAAEHTPFHRLGPLSVSLSFSPTALLSLSSRILHLLKHVENSALFRNAQMDERVKNFVPILASLHFLDACEVAKNKVPGTH